MSEYNEEAMAVALPAQVQGQVSGVAVNTAARTSVSNIGVQGSIPGSGSRLQLSAGVDLGRQWQRQLKCLGPRH